MVLISTGISFSEGPGLISKFRRFQLVFVFKKIFEGKRELAASETALSDLKLKLGINKNNNVPAIVLAPPCVIGFLMCPFKDDTKIFKFVV